MVRWRYRGTTVFFIGLLLAATAFASVAGCALLENAARPVVGGAEPVLSGAFLVRHPFSDPPAALFRGGAPFRARPLGAAPACLEILRAHRAVAGVLPFSLAPVELKGAAPGRFPVREMCAVALDDETWRLYGARLVPGSAGLPRSLAGGIVIDEATFAKWEPSRGGSAPARFELFIDRPAARDPFNLAAVTLAGSYGVPAAEAKSAAVPLCFVSPESLLKSSWLTLGGAAAADSAPAAFRPAPRPAAFREKAGAGTPLALSFLFSLGSAARPGESARPAYPPAFLLVSLSPADAPRRDVVLRELGAAFERRRLEAVIEPWDPAARRAAPCARPLAAALALAAALLAIVAVANVALKPVLTDVLPEDEPGGGFGLAFWRPSFLARNAFIALTSGAVGTISALASIFAYNLLAPPVVRETAAAWLGVAADPLPVPWTGLGAAGAVVVLFTALTPFGPRRRAKKIVRTLTAAPNGPEAESDKKGSRP